MIDNTDKCGERNFIFYSSFSDALEYVPDDIFCKVVRAIIRYGSCGELPEGLDSYAMALFTLMKPQIDASTARYDRSCRGGAPRGNSNNPNGRRGKAKQESTPEIQESSPTTNQETTSETKQETTSETSQETAQEPTIPTLEPTKLSQNNDSSRNNVGVSACAREKFLNDFFSETRIEAVKKQAVMLQVDDARYRYLVEEVLDDWEVNGPVPEPTDELRLKMINTVRKKHHALKEWEQRSYQGQGSGVTPGRVTAARPTVSIPLGKTAGQIERDKMYEGEYLSGEALARKLANAPWKQKPGTSAAS